MAYGYPGYGQQGPVPPGVMPGMQGAPGAPQQGNGQMPQTNPGVDNPMAASPNDPTANIPAQAAPQASQPGTDPALMAAMLGLVGQQTGRDRVSRQYKIADQLRGAAGDQLQGSQQGRLYQHPGWANVLASVAQNYAAKHVSDRADEDARGLDQSRQAALGDYFKALTGNRQSSSDGSGQ
jgi:hypothetical protein